MEQEIYKRIAKARLSRSIERALGTFTAKWRIYFIAIWRSTRTGEDVQIGRPVHPLVRVLAFQKDVRPRQGSQLGGKFWIARDFSFTNPEIEMLFYAEEP
jgi:hypothetical protein